MSKRTRQPRKTYRLAAFDGHHAGRNMLPAYTDHRHVEVFLSEKDALTALHAWVAAHPVHDGDLDNQARAYVQERITRTGDCYTIARWEILRETKGFRNPVRDNDGRPQWVETYTGELVVTAA